VVGPRSTPAAEPDAAQYRELVQQIAASRHFRRSARQRELFLYLCRFAIEDPGAELNEQRIGAELFGRAPNYDTSDDTIVRVHASDLRKRLKAYFETDGAASPLQVEVPKGGYMPVFVRRQNPATPDAPTPVRPSVRWRTPAAIALAAALAALSAWWARGAWDERTASGELFLQPTLARLWSQFDHPDQRTLLVVADSTHGLLQDLRHSAVPLSDYAGRDYWRGAEADDAVRMLKNREYTGLADLALVRKLAVGYGRRQGRLQVFFARHFQMRLLNTENAILVGSKRSNPWAELFEPMLNFSFDYDESSGRALVRNRAPKPGEQPVYSASIASDGVKQGYAVVAYLPNLRRTGSVLLLAGTSTAETEIAGFFATTEDTFSRFVARLPKAAGGALPYFEVLLKTQRVGQDPQRHEVIAFRLPTT